MLLLTSLYAKADELINIYFNNSDLSPVRVEISTISSIKFKANKFVITSKDNITNDFYFSDVRKITFNEGETFIEDINTKTTLSVYPSPATNELRIEGNDEMYNSDVYIYTLTGTLVAKHPQWNGETIDISSLASGIYFININSTTLKFVKQ